MALSDLAAKETSALVEHLERELSELTRRLTAAAEAERTAAVTRVTEERTAAVARLTEETTAAVARLADESASAADAFRAEIAERVAEGAATMAALTEARAQGAATMAALTEARAEGAATTAALTEARAQSDSLRTALENVEGLLATARTDLIETRRAVEQGDTALADALAARDKETAARAIAETDLQDLRAVIQEHEVARAELEAKMEAAARRDSVDSSLLDGLLGAFGTLGTATTIPDILTTLVEQLAAEFPRVALFRPRAHRLEGQHQIGFDLSNDITKVVMPLSLDSLLTRAASSGRVESMSGGELAAGSHVPFGGSPMCAVALPIVVQGDTLGVVYADDSGSDRVDTPSERAARIKYCEAMLQHAVALLMRLNNELKMMAELRAYAGSLLNEIEQMYRADVEAEKSGEELRRRLQANVEYARSIFAARVALECPDAARLIEDEIATVLQRESGGAFGRDLEAVTGQSDRRAEAS